MNQEVVEYYKVVQQMHAELYQRSKKLVEAINTCTDLGELTDYAYALRDASKLLEDSAKDARKAQKRASDITCILWVQHSAADASFPDKIKTEHCTGTPQVKFAGRVPRPGTPEYDELLAFMGMPEGLIKSGVMRTHWPSFVDYLTRLAEEGKPLPPGVDPETTYPVYELRLRKGKCVDE